eukprot:COSAG01_NODE_9137_length_2541_cov_4.615479_2_plen_68_part_00
MVISVAASVLITNNQAVRSDELARRHALARERVAGRMPPASARHLGLVLPPSGKNVGEFQSLLRFSP